MTDFKPGDRVTIRLGVHAYNDYETGYVSEVREGSDGHPRQLVLENGHWGYVENAEHAPETPKLTKLFSEPSPFTPEPRPLVGPAPTPPATPRYVAPFRASGTLVRDATDSVVLEVNFICRDTRNVLAFAAYVATALNASVFNEE